MSTEEEKTVARLLDASATAGEHTSALKWISEYLEEGYILNLRPSPEILAALLKFSRSTKGEGALTKRAASLHKKYRPKR